MGNEASAPVSHIPLHLQPLDATKTIEIGQPTEKKLRIVCISDTHGYHGELQLPPGDILIHTGDFTNFYNSLEDLEDFNKWLGHQPFRYKMVISGNHDYCLTPRQKKRNKDALSNATHYLEDSAVEIEGLKFWGSPWHVHRESILYWANNFGLDERAIIQKWGLIPPDTDILLTHFPSFGVVAPEGCPHLTKTVLEKVRPKVHIFGHHHPSHGAVEHTDSQGTITFVNAANHILGTKMHPHVVLDYYL